MQDPPITANSTSSLAYNACFWLEPTVDKPLATQIVGDHLNSIAFGKAPGKEADSQPISQPVRQAVSQAVGRASRQADRQAENTVWLFFFPVTDYIYKQWGTPVARHQSAIKW